MLRQGNIDEFSVTVVFRSKAQCEDNGYSLIKHWNAAVGHYSNARWVVLSAPMAALRLLQRTMAIPCEACLALNADRTTESTNITLSEH